ncbi:MAG: hypothetical protein GX093_05815 [Xanthomonadaceae bacterium]|nr:hypothetical protein [Xanthomonadaceae bacterium]
MNALRYQDNVPLRWQELTALPSGAEEERIARDNSRLLQLLPFLEESGQEQHPHDEEPPPRYIQLLEQRLLLLTELLADLLAQSRPLPPSHEIGITANTLDWIDDEPPAPGALLLVELFLHPLQPRPLRLPVEVLAVEPHEDGQQVHARLHVNADHAQAELEKLIFRQHRRIIASRRQGRSQVS